MNAASLAAVLAGCAVAVTAAPGPAVTRLRSLAPGATAAPPVLLTGAALAALTLGPVVSAAALPAALAARTFARRRTAAARARSVAEALPDLCRAAAAELRAGAPPATALARAADDAPAPLRDHLRALAAAPPPPAAWGSLPGAERLVALGALWRVAAHAGNGLADGLDRLAAALAAEQRQRADVAAQLAAPRASAAVLAVLPLLGIGLAASLGARPLAFLLGTPAGAACLLAGAALDATGLWWVRRLTARASP